jgi:hypothetical protein
VWLVVVGEKKEEYEGAGLAVSAHRCAHAMIPAPIVGQGECVDTPHQFDRWNLESVEKGLGTAALTSALDCSSAASFFRLVALVVNMVGSL